MTMKFQKDDLVLDKVSGRAATILSCLGEHYDMTGDPSYRIAVHLDGATRDCDRTFKTVHEAELELMGRAVEAVKHDDGKNRFDLVPYDALEEVVRVYTVGAAKYGDRNWEKGMDFGRVFAAIQRHLSAFWQGEDLDPEDDLSHLAHAAWGCLTLLHYQLNDEYLDHDDRRMRNEGHRH